MRLFGAVALGAAAGGVSRFYLAALIQQRAGAFPLGTLVINVTGSFLLGFLLGYSLESGGMREDLRVLLTTGFCGGYTTFSTFSVDTLALLQNDQYARAASYVSASVVLSIAAAFGGLVLAKYVVRA